MALELVAKLTLQKAVCNDGTSQQHKSFMRGVACLFTHPQLSELMQPGQRPLYDPPGFAQPAPMLSVSLR
jgi:hypothetical protein